MAIAATTGHRTGFAPRAALIVAAMILFGTGAWFAASWIDTGGDTTCGAVTHPDIWLNDSSPGSCQGVMAIRSTISAATLAAAGAALYIAARRRSVTPARAVAVLAVTVATSAAVILINEFVRSDGSF
jgi:hypothetical protein